MGNIIAEKTYREHPSSVRANDTGGTVECQHVEEKGVARLQRPTKDIVGVAVGFNIRYLLKRALGKPIRFVVHEGTRQPPRPAMRPP